MWPDKYLQTGEGKFRFGKVYAESASSIYTRKVGRLIWTMNRSREVDYTEMMRADV